MARLGSASLAVLFQHQRKTLLGLAQLSHHTAQPQFGACALDLVAQHGDDLFGTVVTE